MPLEDPQPPHEPADAETEQNEGDSEPHREGEQQDGAPEWIRLGRRQASVPASTGPMHGVQPAANAIPSGNAATRPGRTRDNSGRRSANNDADPSRSTYITRNTPTARTASPAIRWPAVERTMGTSTPANAPSEVNTTENPATNNSTGIVWRVRVLLSAPVEA